MADVQTIRRDAMDELTVAVARARSDIVEGVRSEQTGEWFRSGVGRVDRGLACRRDRAKQRGEMDECCSRVADTSSG